MGDLQFADRFNVKGEGCEVREIDPESYEAAVQCGEKYRSQLLPDGGKFYPDSCRVDTSRRAATGEGFVSNPKKIGRRVRVVRGKALKRIFMRRNPSDGTKNTVIDYEITRWGDTFSDGYDQDGWAKNDRIAKLANMISVLDKVNLAEASERAYQAIKDIGNVQEACDVIRAALIRQRRGKMNPGRGHYRRSRRAAKPIMVNVAKRRLETYGSKMPIFFVREAKGTLAAVAGQKLSFPGFGVFTFFGYQDAVSDLWGVAEARSGASIASGQATKAKAIYEAGKALARLGLVKVKRMIFALVKKHGNAN